MSTTETEIIAVSDHEETRRINLAAGILVVFCALFRLWYASRHELLQDEAYYWQWSRHLDWGYYDNTPLVAPVIHFFTSALGQTELGVRAGAVVSAAIVSLFIYLLAKRLFGARVALVSLVLASIIPIYADASFMMTQDPVQLALWAVTLYVVHKALAGKRGFWYLGGVLAGLAGLAKLNALLLLPSILLYILVEPQSRKRWLARPEPYLAGLIALLVFSPFVWWDHTHGNAFWFHINAMGSRSTSHDPPLKWFGRFIGEQAFMLSPFLFLTYLYTLFKSGRQGISERDAPLLYVWCPSVVVFVVTSIVSLRSKVEGNWAVGAYVTGVILLALTLHRIWEHRGRVGKVWVSLACVLSMLINVVVLYPITVYKLGLKFHNPTKDRTNEFHGWHALAHRITDEQAAMPPGAFVFGINYRMPSEASFYLPGNPATYSFFLRDRSNEYMFWEDPKTLTGRNAIFINDTDAPDHLDDVRAVFDRVEVQPPLRIYRDPPYGKTPIRTIQIFRCYGFKGYDVKQWQTGW